jgi:hypothetical protein
LLGCSPTQNDATPGQANAILSEGPKTSPERDDPQHGGAGAAPGRDESVDAVELTVRAGGRSEHVTVSEIGSVALIDADAAAGTPPLEVVVDYRNDLVLVEDVPNQTYSTLSLSDYAKERQPVLAGQSTGQALPTQSVQSTHLRQKIAGLAARAYLSTINGVTTRVWYSEDLPLPPPNVRRQLAGMGPVGGADGNGGDAGTGHHTNDSDDGEDDDDACPVSADELAGRTILRTEKAGSSGQWTIANDTLAAKQTRLASKDLAPPPGFTITPLPSPPTTVNQAFDSITCDQGDPDGAYASVIPNGGQTLQNVNIYAAYFGAGFVNASSADFIGFVNVFAAPLFLPFTTSYLSGLQQYGVQSAGSVNLEFFGAALPGSFSDPLTDVATVMGLEASGFAPTVWWRTDKYAPLVFLVFDDSVSPSSGYGGYHLAAPANDWIYLPLPLQLASNPLIPYAVATIPKAGLAVTGAALANRDQENCGSSCSAIWALDTGTEAISHELVEALTDPFPFTGWANLGLIPAWRDGEIADICDLTCPNDGSKGVPGFRVAREGNTVLSTYWSNASGTCIPTWQPSVTITSPASGRAYTLAQASAGIVMDASVSNALDQGTQLANAVVWSVDGPPNSSNQVGAFNQSGTGSNVTNTLQLTVPPGEHTIFATYNEEGGRLSVSDSITINILPAPNVAIDSPANGATFPVGTTITLVSHGTDGDFPAGIPDGWFYWTMDGAFLGNNSTQTVTLNRPGVVTIRVQVEDSAGASAQASVALHVSEPTSGPTVTITSPANGYAPDWMITNACDYDALTCPITVTFTATATNPDGTAIDPSEIQWSDPQDGALGTGASITHTFTIPFCINSSASMTAAVPGPNGLSTDSVIISFVSHGC